MVGIRHFATPTSRMPLMTRSWPTLLKLLRGEGRKRVTLPLYDLEAVVDVPPTSTRVTRWVVLAGSIEVTVENQLAEMRQGDTFLIPAGKRHSAKTAAGRCRLFESYSPKR